MAAPSWASELVETVRELRLRPRTLVGDDILVVSTPVGPWRIRMELRLRRNSGASYWNLSIHGPAKSGITCYSADGLLRAIVAHYGQTEGAEPLTPTLDEWTLPLAPTVEEGGAGTRAPLEEEYARVRAALRIQTAHRARRSRNEVRLLITCRRRIAALERTLEDLRGGESRHYTSTRASFRAFLSSDLTERAFLEDCPVGASFCVPVLHHLDLETGMCAPLSQLLFQNPSHAYATREGLRASARRTVEAALPADDVHSLFCAKAILRTPHFPLIVGELALPMGRRASCGRIFKPTSELSQQHVAAIARHFGPEWIGTLRHMIESCALTVYDVFEDRYDRTFLGGVVLQKFAVRIMGQLSPVVGIASIVALHPAAGVGAAIFEFCKQLLFADDPQITHGFVFAQCLIDTPFWELRMDKTNFARTLCFQLAWRHEGAYHYEQFCEMRSTLVSRGELDGPVPSPEKM